MLMMMMVSMVRMMKMVRTKENDRDIQVLLLHLDGGGGEEDKYSDCEQRDEKNDTVPFFLLQLDGYNEEY